METHKDDVLMVHPNCKKLRSKWASILKTVQTPAVPGPAVHSPSCKVCWFAGCHFHLSCRPRKLHSNHPPPKATLHQPHPPPASATFQGHTHSAHAPQSARAPAGHWSSVHTRGARPRGRRSTAPWPVQPVPREGPTSDLVLLPSSPCSPPKKNI